VVEQLVPVLNHDSHVKRKDENMFVEYTKRDVFINIESGFFNDVTQSVFQNVILSGIFKTCVEHRQERG
jgi:hypothetical protein